MKNEFTKFTRGRAQKGTKETKETNASTLLRKRIGRVTTIGCRNA